MEKLFVSDIEIGKEIISFFALRKKELREYDEKKFLILELGDRTGRIDAVLWIAPQEAFRVFEKGQIVKVKGVTGLFREKLQLTVEKIRVAKPEEYEREWFLGTSEKDILELFNFIEEVREGILNPSLQKLLSIFFDDEEFKKVFMEAPGAKMWHHPYLGGLLEHTVGVTKICQWANTLYPSLNSELLLCGALLHDVGKTKELQWTTFIDYTDEGRLLGHISIGDRMIAEKIAMIEQFPVELAIRLRHIVLSHHGELQQGSPVVPMSLEALIVYSADHMDAHANAYMRIIKKEGGLKKRWSEWVNLIDRYLYLGDETENE